MEHEMTSVTRELSMKSEDDGSDGEHRLEIADHPDSHPDFHPDSHPDFHPDSRPDSETGNTNQDAVESLLLLGRQPVVSPEIQRQRAASISDPHTVEMSNPVRELSRRHSVEAGKSIIGTLDKGGINPVMSYYQKMRERNNEASKRCRLKRRMKAVSLENQSSMLNMANKMLKQRIQRLEQVGAALKEGVKNIQAGHCACDMTKGVVRQTSRDYYDPDPAVGRDLPSFELISKSRSIRENDGINYVLNNGGNEFLDKLQNSNHQLLGNSCSSEEDILTTPNSPMMRTEIVASPKPQTPTQPRSYKTALDVINETIVKTLDTPLNLVKTSNSPSPQNIILLSPPRQSIDSVASADSGHPSAVVSAVASNAHAPLSAPVKLEQPEVDSSTPVCIANANGTSLCRGEVLNLNKLTAYLDLVTRAPVKDSADSAMERAIIKSRLKIPFWSADNETAMFICESHRTSVVQGTDLSCCTMCNKRRTAKKARMVPINMYTITYSMSLEYYTRTGYIMPIGLAVCGFCREKHLKSIDLSNSKLISLPDPFETSQNQHSPTLISSTSLNHKLKRETNSPISQISQISAKPHQKIRQLSTNSSCSNVSSTNGDVQILQISQQNHSNIYINNTPADLSSTASGVKSVVPVSSSSNVPNNTNVFAKIGRLNEALQAINPRYQPIGFSITSMDSCSPSVLQDAISAAETGVYTLLSVIAPGQESQLWETIRPSLDLKLVYNKQNGGPK